MIVHGLFCLLSLHPSSDFPSLSACLPLLQDGLVLCHWRRAADEGKEYPFARFNKSLDIPAYSEEDYTVS